jgi:hypothetical protein
MKTISTFTKLLFLFAFVLSFVACEKEHISNPSDELSVETTNRADADRFRDCFHQEPIAGSFCYEDGLSTTWVDNANGYTTHTLESGSGKGYVVDANLDRIVFRSTTHKLGRKVLIHNMSCTHPQTPCVKVIHGEIYTQGNATYVKIDAADIFECIWPQTEEFDFNYALVGAKL